MEMLLSAGEGYPHQIFCPSSAHFLYGMFPIVEGFMLTPKCYIEEVLVGKIEGRKKSRLDRPRERCANQISWAVRVSIF
jgi:hypothetical protein